MRCPRGQCCRWLRAAAGRTPRPPPGARLRVACGLFAAHGQQRRAGTAPSEGQEGAEVGLATGTADLRGNSRRSRTPCTPGLSGKRSWAWWRVSAGALGGLVCLRVLRGSRVQSADAGTPAVSAPPRRALDGPPATCVAAKGAGTAASLPLWSCWFQDWKTAMYSDMFETTKIKLLWAEFG